MPILGADSHKPGYIGWRWTVVCVASALAACGGADTADPVSSLRRDAESLRVVAPADLPELHRCLTDTVRILESKSAQPDNVLRCAAGIYTGLAADGRACELRIDAQRGRLSFASGPDVVSIDAAVVAHEADGSEIFNLAPASVGPGKPGVMLTRFSPVEALTESIVLRAGSPVQGPNGLPQLSYLRVQGDSMREQRCSFGA